MSPPPGTACTLQDECLVRDAGAAREPVKAGAPQVLTESVARSPEGGHIRVRILHHPGSGAVVEEVELHCQTLTFEIITDRAQSVSSTRR